MVGLIILCRIGLMSCRSHTIGLMSLHPTSSASAKSTREYTKACLKLKFPKEPNFKSFTMKRMSNGCIWTPPPHIYDNITFDSMTYEVIKYDSILFEVVTYDIMTYDVMTYDIMTYEVITNDVFA